jgi:hypothetical protein
MGCLRAVHGHHCASANIINRIFADVDMDGDDSIGFDEFVMVHAKLGARLVAASRALRRQ